jgi:thioredoxin-dependent peroxiredoxin
VSFDTPEDNRAFAEKFSFNFPLLCDTSRRIGMDYGAADSPTAASARRIGVVIGPDGRIVEYLPKVDPASYPQEVLSRLAEPKGADEHAPRA